MLVPPASCRHDAGTLCCIISAYILFLSLSKLLFPLAWVNDYENYSFLLDHLSVIARFLSDITLTLVIFAVLRLALDFTHRKISAADEESEDSGETRDLFLRRRVHALAGFCAFLIHALNFAYGAALALLLLFFARLTLAHYSPLLFYRHYRSEPFQY